LELTLMPPTRRYALRDDQWDQIWALLPGQEGHRGVTAADNRLFGQAPKDADTYFAGACPIVASFGRRDPTLIGAAKKLEQALTLNGVEHEVKLYPDTSHGFMDDHAKDKLPLPLVIVKTILNVGYHGPSAVDAKRRISTFFDRHLKD
jgi:carboxymethylenebutenolidase